MTASIAPRERTCLQLGSRRQHHDRQLARRSGLVFRPHRVDGLAGLPKPFALRACGQPGLDLELLPSDSHRTRGIHLEVFSPLGVALGSSIRPHHDVAITVFEVHERRGANLAGLAPGHRQKQRRKASPRANSATASIVDRRVRLEHRLQCACSETPEAGRHGGILSARMSRRPVWFAIIGA